MRIELHEGGHAVFCLYGFEFEFDFDDFFNLREKPFVDFGQVKHLVHRHALREGVADIPNTLRTGLAQFFFQYFAVLGFFVHALDTDLEATEGFLEGFLEGATHGHHLTHRFHLGGETRIGGGELFKGKTWDFGDHVVNTGLKARGGCTASDFVFEFVQRIANGQFGRHFGNRKTCGFGGQCTGA